MIPENVFRSSKLRAVVPLLLALLLSACSASARQPDAPSSSLTFQPCQLRAEGMSESIEAECTTLDVFENREAGSGRTIPLNVAVVRAILRSSEPDPLFFLTGGPGQAATESYPQMAPAFDRIRQERDIVLVDQRGTGQSNPLDCVGPEDEAALEEEDGALEAWLAECLESLDADPALYTTTIAMDDLDQVRQALGYDQINLYGISYGTRAALSYLRQYPDNVRAMILDGLAPPTVPLGLDVAKDAQRALDLAFDRCAADTACQSAFPDVRAEFERLLSTLESEPASLSLPHPSTGEPTDLTLTREMVGSAVRLLSYSTETVALLPLLIHEAAAGNLAPLAAQYLVVSDQLGSSMSNGMGYSVLCAEDVPFYTAEDAAAANEGAYLADLQTETLDTVCDLWPTGSSPEDVKAPVVSDVPALLLSGEADPVTPPSNASVAAETLSNSLHLVVPGQGHGVIQRGCLYRIAETFIESGATEGLDTDCIDEIEPFPFFLNFSGPDTAGE